MSPRLRLGKAQLNHSDSPSLAHEKPAGGASVEDICDVHVCPGCHAVGWEPCAPGCIDAEIEAEHHERDWYGPDSEDEQ